LGASYAAGIRTLGNAKRKAHVDTENRHTDAMAVSVLPRRGGTLASRVPHLVPAVKVAASTFAWIAGVFNKKRESAKRPAARKAPTWYRSLRSPDGRPLPQVPPAGLPRRRRPRGDRQDAEERDIVEPGPSGVSLRRSAWHGQDLARAHPRERAQLRERADAEP